MPVKLVVTMHKSLRLLALGWVAATAATALGQNSRYLGDLRSVDREFLNAAAVAPGSTQPSSAQARSAQANPNRAAVNPREQRKRKSLFGMLTAWAGGSEKDQGKSTAPPAPAGAFAAKPQARPGAPQAPRQGAAPMTRWSRKPEKRMPLAVQTVGSLPAAPPQAAVKQAGGAGLPLPMGPASTPSFGPATPNAIPPRMPAQMHANPAIVALANAPDPQATPLALKASPSTNSNEPSLHGMVFVTDDPTVVAITAEAEANKAEAVPPPIETVAAEEPPAVEAVAAIEAEDATLPLEEPAPTESVEEPAETAVALEPAPIAPPPVVEPIDDQPLGNEPQLLAASQPTETEPVETEIPAPEATEPVVIEPETLAEAEVAAAPIEEDIEAFATDAGEALANATPEEPSAVTPDEGPTPELSQPALSPAVIATDNADSQGYGLLATERTAPGRQHARLGLPPRRPAPEREPSDRAKILLTEAHELARYAVTTEEYTGIVQRCRYVLAFDKAPQAVAYAHELGAWSLNCRGETLMEEGRVEEAEADFHDALLTDADCWRAEHNLGVVLMRRGELDEARRRFDRTLELNPEFAKAYSNRAAIAVQSGEFDAALTDYERAIEADPDLAVAHTGRGRLCHMLGSLQLAQRHLDAAALLAPEDAAIAIARGDLLVDFGRYGPALAAYEHAIQLDPESPIAFRNLAWLQATCPVAVFRDGEAALRHATRATELSAEEDDIALDTYAAALAAAGHFEEAAETQRRAAEMAPEADAEAYLDRMALYLSGESFTSQPIGSVQQATYTR